jgi:benzoate membrane transport protein
LQFFKDLSISALVAGFVAVLVGFTSSAIIVFQAAQALGASPAETASWLWALGLAMMLTSVGLSLRYKIPVLTAWSTPGAAMLVTSVSGVTMPQAIGAFMVCAALIILVGATGWFEHAMKRIPPALGAAMLAGVLLRFGIDGFAAMKTELLLVLVMVAVYLLMRRVAPRYAVPAVLGAGIIMVAARGQLPLSDLSFALTRPVFIMPELSIKAIVGVALPLFAVTMASQNIPGVAVMRSAGYDPPVSPIITWTGVSAFLLAPFGAFAVNFAAITAAICASDQADHDPARRYTAAVSAGVFYFLVGTFAATVTSVFAAFPAEMVVALAGIALINTIGAGLLGALEDAEWREPALITFLVTASGVSIAGIGAAFWGLVAGIVATLVLRSAGLKVRPGTVVAPVIAEETE